MIAPSKSLSDYLYRVYVPSKLDLTPGSIEQLAIAVRLFERWAGRPLSIYDFSEGLLRDFLVDYKATGKSARTVNGKRTSLLTLWRHAYEEGLLGRPPRMSRVPRARHSPPIPEAWAPEQVGRLLAAAATRTGTVAGLPRAAWKVSLLLTLYDTGCRRSEALRVQPGDCDLAAGTILFRKTKTGVPRLCRLAPETIEAIGSIYGDRERLWPWPHVLSTLHARFVKLCIAAGIPYGRSRGGCWHKLRRTHATLVEVNGGDGARAIGDTRAVFEKHYLDRRMMPGTLKYLPRPRIP